MIYPLPYYLPDAHGHREEEGEDTSSVACGWYVSEPDFGKKVIYQVILTSIFDRNII